MKSLNLLNFNDIINKKIEKNGNIWTITSYLKNESNSNVYNIKKNNENEDYIIKMEDIESGPLFCEFHFYLKIKNSIRNDINILPMIESGLKIYVNNRRQRNIILYKKKYCLQDYRFINLDYFKNENDIMIFSINIIKTLEFINSLKYVNGDIKPRNIVFDIITEPYIIDFGIVENYERKKYIKDENNINGSSQYMSIDAHNGIISQRTDLISFGFILFSILEKKKLPWFNIANLDEILEIKKEFLKNKKMEFFTHPKLISYFSIVNSRECYEKPLYNKIYEIFN